MAGYRRPGHHASLGSRTWERPRARICSVRIARPTQSAACFSARSIWTRASALPAGRAGTKTRSPEPFEAGPAGHRSSPRVQHDPDALRQPSLVGDSSAVGSGAGVASCETSTSSEEAGAASAGACATSAGASAAGVGAGTGSGVASGAAGAVSAASEARSAPESSRAGGGGIGASARGALAAGAAFLVLALPRPFPPRPRGRPVSAGGSMPNASATLGTRAANLVTAAISSADGSAGFDAGTTVKRTGE